MPGQREEKVGSKDDSTDVVVRGRKDESALKDDEAQASSKGAPLLGRDDLDRRLMLAQNRIALAVQRMGPAIERRRLAETKLAAIEAEQARQAQEAARLSAIEAEQARQAQEAARLSAIETEQASQAQEAARLAAVVAQKAKQAAAKKRAKVAALMAEVEREEKIARQAEEDALKAAEALRKAEQARANQAPRSGQELLSMADTNPSIRIPSANAPRAAAPIPPSPAPNIGKQLLSMLQRGAWPAAPLLPGNAANAVEPPAEPPEEVGHNLSSHVTTYKILHFRATLRAKEKYGFRCSDQGAIEFDLCNLFFPETNPSPSEKGVKIGVGVGGDMVMQKRPDQIYCRPVPKEDFEGKTEDGKDRATLLGYTNKGNFPIWQTYYGTQLMIIGVSSIKQNWVITLAGREQRLVNIVPSKTPSPRQKTALVIGSEPLPGSSPGGHRSTVFSTNSSYPTDADGARTETPKR